MLFIANIPSSRISPPWRWRRHVPPKRQFEQDRHGFTYQKSTFFNTKTDPTISNIFKVYLWKSFRPQPIFFFQVAPHLTLQGLSESRSRPTATQKIWQRRESNPGPLALQPGSMTTRPQWIRCADHATPLYPQKLALNFVKWRSLSGYTSLAD
jgi:hypothetical protein